ncbi:DUF1294 domain-containing protein [Salibacterium aidingense]|uniref:DUF1294 domain-containing protein n=1 Tax=Salibacterium aidingense TaxID=384933 RepID=UPI000416293E|nr:DUF1294 domain-containing protein [Salibacterium aidingense]
MPLFILYLLGINAVAWAVMGWDKRKARQRKRRFRERTLWILALLGGSIGIQLAMMSFHHKTRHITFKLGVPFLLAVQGVILILLFQFEV